MKILMTAVETSWQKNVILFSGIFLNAIFLSLDFVWNSRDIKKNLPAKISTILSNFKPPLKQQAFHMQNHAQIKLF